MRRIALILLPVTVLAACSATLPGRSDPNAPVTVNSTKTAAPSVSAAKIPAELALSIHYRRSPSAQQAFAPVESFLRELILQAPEADRADMTLALDEAKKIKSVDLIVAAATTPLTKLEDLTPERACVLGRVSVEPGMIATTIQGAPEQEGVTVKTEDDFTYAWTTGCASLAPFKDLAAMQATIAGLNVEKATLASHANMGHALLHDPLLWKEIQAKYEEGLEQALADNDDPKAARGFYDRAVAVVTHLNIWHVIQETQTSSSSWTFNDNGMWSMEARASASTTRTAELLRRASVGSVESGILFLGDKVEQKVTSSVQENDMAISVVYTNPDITVLIRPLSGMFLGAAMAAGMGESFTNDLETFGEDFEADIGDDIEIDVVPPTAPAAPSVPSES